MDENYDPLISLEDSVCKEALEEDWELQFGDLATNAPEYQQREWRASDIPQRPEGKKGLFQYYTRRESTGGPNLVWDETIFQEDLGDIEKANAWDDEDTESEEKAEAYGRHVEIQVPFRKSHWTNFKNAVRREGVTGTIITLWVCCCLGIVVWKFYQYLSNPATRELSPGIAVAKAMAFNIMFNLSIMSLLVSRVPVNMIYTFAPRDLFPLRRAKYVHKLLAIFVFACATIHVIAHYYNLYALSHAPMEKLQAALGNATATAVYGGDYPNSVYALLLYTSIPGLTGHLLIFVFIIVFLSSRKKMVNQYYEAFFWTHMLYVVTFVLLLVHGAAHLIEHASAPYWFAPFLGYFMIERFVRYLRRLAPLQVVSLRHIDKDIVSIVVEKPTRNKAGFPWTYTTGQYAFICIPEISQLQWHPFTVTSFQDDILLMFDIKVAGKGSWTRQLSELVVQNKAPKEIFIDGCYGADSQIVSTYKHVVLIGAGIGVTPYVAVLRHFKHTHYKNPKHANIYMIGVFQGLPYTFLLKILREIQNDPTLVSILEVFLYITRGKKDRPLGIFGEIQYGQRPNFQDIFKSLCAKHPGDTIGVFCCGPARVTETIRQACTLMTNLTSTKYVFHKEIF